MPYIKQPVLGASFNQHPGYVSGRLYPLAFQSVRSPLNFGLVAETIFFAAFWIPDITIATFTSRNASPGPWSYRFGVWANTDSQPGALLFDSGMLTHPGAPADMTFAAGLTLQRNWYWYGITGAAPGFFTEGMLCRHSYAAGIPTSLVQDDAGLRSAVGAFPPANPFTSNPTVFVDTYSGALRPSALFTPA